MKRNLIRFATMASLAASAALAQSPSASAQPSQPSPAKPPFARRAAMRRHLMEALNLTDAQKQQAKTIFQGARQSTQPLRQELRQNRQALAVAVKANDTAKIQQLSQTEGNLLGKVIAIRTEANAKFYAILTPEQRAKADQIRQQMKQHFQQRLGQRSNG